MNWKNWEVSHEAEGKRIRLGSKPTMDAQEE